MNPAAIKAIAAGDLTNALVASTPGGIEAQEAAGQASLVRAADRLPIAMHPRTISRERLEEAWGIKFHEAVDELFVAVTLPVGWTIRATEHAMHSDLLDAGGHIRAGIFYKAAFYDRRASMYITRRYVVDADYEHETLHSVRAVDKKTGALLRESERINRTEVDRWRQVELEMRKWLDEQYPQNDDPLAYWSDV